jgi:hypothetical protein
VSCNVEVSVFGIIGSWNLERMVKRWIGMDRNIHMMCTPNSEKYHLITRLELNYIV